MNLVPNWINDIGVNSVYVAPTIYKLKGITPTQLPRWNYYNTFTEAVTRYNQLKAGSGTLTSAGSIDVLTYQAQTLGVSCDFYINKDGAFFPAKYSWLRSNLSTNPLFIARLYLTNGQGPFYTVFNSSYMGISANVIYAASDQGQAIEALYKEMTVLKFRYNYLSSFLTELSKKQLSQKEQQIFNEGVLLLQNLNNSIRQINGIEIYYNANGQLGFIQLLLIAAIVIVAAAAAWTISDIVAEKEKTRRINDAYEVSNWVISKKTEVAAMASAGTISQADKQSIFANLETSLTAAEKIAASSAKNSGGAFSNIADVVKWGAVGVLGYQLLKTFNSSRNG